jgi:molybdopterin-guanine dinucleotide biosynthesis protein A
MSSDERQARESIERTSEGRRAVSLDAIVMAGDREASRPVKGSNKALLEIHGIPLVGYVVSALERSRYVSRIFVVGPKKEITEALEKRPRQAETQKPVLVVEQWNTLVENAWNTFLKTLKEGQGPEPLPDERTLRARYKDKVALVVGADIPLLTPYEVDEFIEGSDLERYDFLLGMTPREALEPYYPTKDRPGIKLAYFALKDSLERQNNLHLVRFFAVGNRDYVEKMYRHRYQRRWKNIVRLAWTILRIPEMRPWMVLSFLLLHLARILEGLGLSRLRAMVARFLDRRRLEEAVSQILKTRFASVRTHYGGAALDVDNEEHLRCIEANFDLWQRFQQERYEARRKGEAQGSRRPIGGSLEGESNRLGQCEVARRQP